MDDYISRQAAIDILMKEWKAYKDYPYVSHVRHGLEIAIAILENKVPSAQPERKKGEWIWCGNHHICSECDEWALTRWDEDKCDEVDILTDFCPNCGADMRGEQDG